MGTARIHEGVRQMRFEGLLDRQTRGEITQEEAATVLGVSVRTFQRWRNGMRRMAPMASRTAG
jgi:DNA-binding transcriptional regulator YiaG